MNRLPRLRLCHVFPYSPRPVRLCICQVALSLVRPCVARACSSFFSCSVCQTTCTLSCSLSFSFFLNQRSSCSTRVSTRSKKKCCLRRDFFFGFMSNHGRCMTHSNFKKTLSTRERKVHVRLSIERAAHTHATRMSHEFSHEGRVPSHKVGIHKHILSKSECL